jgi:uncharacterized protein YaaN involved in tellurite resistance
MIEITMPVKPYESIPGRPLLGILIAMTSCIMAAILVTTLMTRHLARQAREIEQTMKTRITSLRETNELLNKDAEGLRRKYDELQQANRESAIFNDVITERGLYLAEPKQPLDKHVSKYQTFEPDIRRSAVKAR